MYSEEPAGLKTTSGGLILFRNRLHSYSHLHRAAIITDEETQGELRRPASQALRRP